MTYDSAQICLLMFLFTFRKNCFDDSQEERRKRNNAVDRWVDMKRANQQNRADATNRTNDKFWTNYIITRMLFVGEQYYFFCNFLTKKMW